MSKVKVSLSYAGIGSILRSQEMAACVKAEADRCASGLGEGYQTDSKSMGTRQIASIFTATSEAAKDNMKNNSLLKAVGK